ncbi:MAG: ABC transporter permease [Conexibacter sp.]
MLAFVARRLLALAATLLASSFVIFGCLYLAPGSPESFLSGGRTLSPEGRAAIRAQYGLDDPFLTRYWHWLTGVLHGDLGQSIIFRQDVTSLIEPRIATTALLVGYAAILILAIGIGLGVVAALKSGGVDVGVVLTTTLGMAVPSFVAAMVLLSVFAVNLGWFPTLGAGSGFTDRVWHLTLPAVALALAAIAVVAQITRAAMREELEREHVDTARARGLSERTIMRRHVFRNALVPITTISGVTIAGLIAASVVVEQTFALNGLGSFLVTAVNQKDFAIVQAVALILVVVFMVANTVVDLLYGLLDPRMAPGKAA